ncbi:MAG TPA: L-glutamate gamma-semialdehyde dehydrogenase [Cytophagales bacterium]|jgi:1-pyrroline-5-carboxylate dehydrogenase|nr:L-glutamate gamma-semialdehyde dehydrogenase [Cytophagales bacterium]
MNKEIFKISIPINEPILNYSPGSKEKKELKKVLNDFKSKEVDIPMYINGKEIRTDNKIRISPPHNHNHTLGCYNHGDTSHVHLAIKAAMSAKKSWNALGAVKRAKIFLKAADLIAGPYRAKINATTMLGQSKNIFQAEVDAACELIDFLRFNPYYMSKINEEQPLSPEGMKNSLDYRPLEGFVFALSPFNFTSIAGNLCSSVALMGNTVVWKASRTQIYSADIIMKVFKEAGLPNGVINLIHTDGKTAGDIIFKHPDFGGIHFTGSTNVFQNFWKEIGDNISNYKSYPRIVGETGGKDFIIAHKSADFLAISTAIIRGGFEFQGQKCSAPSRVYIPNNLWEPIKENLLNELSTIKMGDPEDFTNFVNAVIDEKAFDNITSYIDFAKKDNDHELLIGGNYDKSDGYYIEPTIFLSSNPKSKLMCEEIFGPIVTIHIYDKEKYEETLDLVNNTSPYALTGAVFAKEKDAINLANKKLEYAAGNFYINDKPTGAVVGQQPFGGSRASGTNDKAGSYLNLLRWVSPRTTKEVFESPTNYRYPFMNEK